MAASVMAGEWQELPERRKDYIAQPKANGYRSLHCAITLPAVTLECPATDQGAAAEECSLQGEATCELQIRTQRKPSCESPQNSSWPAGVQGHAVLRDGSCRNSLASLVVSS